MKVALIGYGLAGSVFHAPLIAATPGLELAAVVTSNPERQDKARSEFPGVEIIENAEDVFSKPKRFDIAVIATPNIHHAPLAKTALECGMATVIDKPMATTVQEAEQLVQLADKLRVPLSVFHNRRWDADFLTVRKLFRDDRLGSIFRFESRFERWRPAVNQNAWREMSSVDEAGGLLFDLGSHLIDQALVLFGEPAYIYAETEKRRQGARSDDDSFVAIKFKSGVTAHLWMNSISAIQGPRYRILGSRGAYQKFGLDPQEQDLRDGKRPVDGSWGKENEDSWGQLKYQDGSYTKEVRVETLPGAYTEYYRLLEGAVRSGSPPPVDAEEAVDTMKVIQFALQSASENRTIAWTK